MITDQEVLEAALEGLEARMRRTNALIAQLRGSSPAYSPADPAEDRQPNLMKKRQMSAEGRARIAEAQRKRWALAKQALAG